MVNETLQEIIKQTKQESFVAEYRDSAKDSEALAIICAKHLKYEPDDVFELVYELLTQINYDHLIEKIEELC